MALWHQCAQVSDMTSSVLQSDVCGFLQLQGILGDPEIEAEPDHGGNQYSVHIEAVHALW